MLAGVLAACRASHHCADRETETSGPRKDALDAALHSLGVQIHDLLQSDQLSGSGSSAVRTYYSYTRPRPGRNHEYADRDIDLSASRAANQVTLTSTRATGQDATTGSPR